MNRILFCCFLSSPIWRGAALAFCVLVGATNAPARADKPLTVADCKALEADKADAVQQGLARDMARGPEWAKTNLGAERLREILRLIEIEELLKFRCERVFKFGAKEQRRKNREAARRLGIKIPPLPVKNPNRSVAHRASKNSRP